VPDLRIVRAFEVRVRGVLRSALALQGLLLSANPVIAEEILFLGAVYLRAGQTHGQTVTKLTEFTKTDTGATGRVDHGQYQGSFDLVFDLDCQTTEFSFQAWLPNDPLQNEYVVLTPYPEWAVIEFSDGLRANVGRNAREPLAEDVARERFLAYPGEGRSDEPLPDVIRYETNRIVWLHADRLRFIAELLLARTCTPAGQGN
jgi:hypothetical protein